MQTSTEIIKDLRKDFAEITGILLYLQNLRPPSFCFAKRSGGGRQFSENQTKAIDEALQGFSFIVVQYIGEIRKSFGEHLWYKLEDIDKPEMNTEKNESRYGIHTAGIVEQLKIKARELNKKLLLLPGDDKCTDEQSKQIARLLDGLGTWRSNELNELIRAF